MKLKRLMKRRRRNLSSAIRSIHRSDCHGWRSLPLPVEAMLLMSASAQDFVPADQIDSANVEAGFSELSADAISLESDGRAARLDSGMIWNLVADGESPAKGRGSENSLPDANASEAEAVPEVQKSPEPGMSSNASLTEVFFIDRSVPDFDSMIFDLLLNRDSDRKLEVILLDSDRGIEQIEDHLSQMTNVAAIHVVAHGSAGQVKLGRDFLSVDSFDDHVASIEAWADVMTERADILFYGCDLAASDDGRKLLNAIRDACDCDVAASNDLTGHKDQGGDWELEYRLGEITATERLSAALEGEWDHVLAIITGTAGADTLIGTDDPDEIFGLGDNDFIQGGAGDDVISGGDGIDTILFDGAYATFSITGTATRNVTRGGGATSETDTVTEAEFFEFADGVLDLATNIFTSVNPAAVSVAAAPLTFTEGDSAQAVDSTLTITDIDSPMLAGATVAVTGGYSSGQDVLAFTNQLGITGSWNPATGVLSLSGQASVGDYQTALRSVTFFNHSDAPSTVARTIEIVASDGGSGGTAGVRQIVVAATNDPGTGVPVVSGSAVESETLTVDTSAITDADGLGVFSYQWLRNGTNIVGATGQTYVPDDADVETRISVRVQYTDGGGTTETMISAMTPLVLNVNDAPAGVPLIGGTLAQGQTLTATNAHITDNDGLGAMSFQWLRDGHSIVGATNQSYVLTNDDVDARLSVRLNYTDAHGTAETLTSMTTSPVTNVNDLPSGVPVIQGVVSEDETLVAGVDGISDLDGIGPYLYQWLRNGVPVLGETDPAYTLGDADVNAYIQVNVSYTDGHGTFETITSVATLPVENVNDDPAGEPNITGILREDEVLSVDVSGISDADGFGLFRYQWFRNGVVITGATNSTYSPVDADVETRIRVRVTYTDLNGTAETLLSTETDVIANVNDAPAGLPTISGGVTENQTLTAITAGISDDDGLGQFHYQWLRNDVDIAGATGFTYTLGNADVASEIRVRVSYTDNHGATETLLSVPTAPVSNVNDTPTGSVFILGEATEDQTLLFDASSIQDADGLGTFQYQWLRDNVAIQGATGTSFTMTDADVGAQIQVRVRYFDGHGTQETLVSAPTDAVANVNDVPAGMVVIQGAATEDVTLFADTSSISDDDGLGLFRYQWLRNGMAISGATNASYTMGDSDVSQTISVRVAWTDANGTDESFTSLPTETVLNINDSPIGRPAVFGTVREDETLTAVTSGISDADGAGDFSYQWLRDGAAIEDASSISYTLGDADVGTQIRVRVTYIDGYGERETVTSSATVAVGNVNDEVGGLPVIVGTAREDQLLTADVSALTDADGLGEFHYQWFRDGAAITGAVDRDYVAGDADVNARLEVLIHYTDGHGTPETLTAAPTLPIENVNDTPNGRPEIFGTPLEDQTLRVSTAAITDADGLGPVSYQWLRNGLPIPEATGMTHLLGDADVNSKISVEVTYVDGNGTAEILSSEPGSPVENINDAPTVSAFGDQFIDLLNGTGPLYLGLNDVDNAAETLVITVTSSNLDVVPLSHILLSGEGFDRTLEIQSALTSEASYSLIVVTITDGMATTEMSFYVATDTAFNSAFLTLENADAEDAADEEETTEDTTSSPPETTAPEVLIVPQVTDALLENFSAGGLLLEENAELEIAKSIAGEGTALNGAAEQIQARLKAVSRNIAADVENLAQMNISSVPSGMELSVLFDDTMFVDGSKETDRLSATAAYQWVTVTSAELTAGHWQAGLSSDAGSEVDLVISEELFETTTGAVLTSVVAVGAVTALGKSTVVGALGTSTTTNSFLYLTSKGKLAATRTLETIVGHLASLSGNVSIKALMFEHLAKAGSVKGASIAGGAALGSFASSFSVLCKFDALQILNDYAARGVSGSGPTV